MIIEAREEQVELQQPPHAEPRPARGPAPGAVAEPEAAGGPAHLDIAPPPPGLAQRRLARLEFADRLELSALQEPDPRKASLVALEAGLMRMAVKIEAVANRATDELENPAPGSELNDPDGFLASPVERFQQVQPLLNAHLRIVKQITRLSEMNTGVVRGGRQPGPGDKQRPSRRLPQNAEPSPQNEARLPADTDCLAAPAEEGERRRQDADLLAAEFKAAFQANRDRRAQRRKDRRKRSSKS